MNNDHAIVSRAEWLAARKALLVREKELTQLSDALSAERRRLPWVRVDKPYVFQDDGGPRGLGELFGDKSQLVIYHFMFGPNAEAGCKSCSFWADNFNGITPHLAARDVAFAAVSRAPLDRLRAFAKRLDWQFRWVSSAGSDFNFDYQVSFTPEMFAGGQAVYNYEPVSGTFDEREGVSVFYRDPQGTIFHTYSSYARGIDTLNTAYHYLDLVPKGRDEAGLRFAQAWVKHRDQYAR